MPEEPGRHHQVLPSGHGGFDGGVLAGQADLAADGQGLADDVVQRGQRANLYRVINRLHEAGLIAVRQTEKDQQFPERTVYELTEAGRRTSREWLTTMLSGYRNEFPEFPAALSFVMLVAPEESLRLLEQRAEDMRQEIAKLDGELDTYSPTLPRVTLLDTEYVRALARAELAWLDALTMTCDRAR